LLRSDALVEIGEAGRAMLEQVGVRRAIDLREPIERELDPVDLSGSQVELVDWPLIDSRIDLTAPIKLTQLYPTIVDRCGERLAGAVNLLAQADALPAVFFCSAGKDRTGLLAALVLSSVGAGDDAVISDYARSEAAFQGSFKQVVTARARAAKFGGQVVAAKGAAPSELIREMLSYLRRNYGGAAQYLADRGVSHHALTSLRSALLCPTNPPHG
jgi:protein-tyrosine phosphatase